MRHRGARIVVLSCIAVLAACGAKTLDFSSPDAGGYGPYNAGGKGGSGGTAGTSGGKGGSAGTVSTTGSGGTTAGAAGTGAAGAGGTGAGAAGAGGTGTGGSSIDGGHGGTAGGTGGTVNDGGPPLPFVSTSFFDVNISKVDLLLTIDNSSSMADKQALLADVVPELVDQLIHPRCIDPVTLRTVGRAVGGVCTTGKLAFAPVADIHVGVVSSSLGNHGANGVCEDNIDISLGRSDPHNNDQGRLIARGAGGPVPTFANKGFLYYNPSTAGALTTSAAVAAPFADMVRGVGQHGCGYEATLESAYRFLVDPDPYATISVDTSTGGFGLAFVNGTDQALLQQRADFLRPDSLVTVLMVTDENDCSIVDGGQGFYPLLPPVTGTGRSALKGGTSACAQNPNDRCCFNCGMTEVPAGCPPIQGDPACDKGELTVAEDPPNLRCFQQKRRYGLDFMYQIQRYVDGFSAGQILNRRGNLVANPLFSDLTCGSPGCGSLRDKRMVIVAGIVGVPWQDIAINKANLAEGNKSARQLRDEDIWAAIVGDPQNPLGPVPPHDAHMIESIPPRFGLAGPGSIVNADPVHGHEWDPSKSLQPNADLQYACVFDLATPKVCSSAEDCDCFGSAADTLNPLCQNASGQYTTTQLRAKAYPGTRILQVLKGLEDQAVTASICAAQTSDKTRSDYGYMPAVNGIIDRATTSLTKQCLPFALPADTTTFQTSCSVIEVFDGPCQCATEPGRLPARAELLTDEMRAKGSCRCEIMQLNGEVNDACRNQGTPAPSSGNGWCYVNPSQLGGSCEVVADCPRANQRLVRFINTSSHPRPNSTAFLRCDLPPVTPFPSICP